MKTIRVLAVACGGVCVVFAVLLWRRAHVQGRAGDQAASDELSADLRPARRSADRIRSRSASRAPAPTPAACSPIDLKRSSHVMLGGIRQLISQRAMAGQVAEAQINQVEDYLFGLIEGLRATNENAFGAISEQLADEVCAGRMDGDVDLTLFSRLTLIQPSVSSERGLNCALKLHKKEDPVLWELLRAWNSSGRPMIPAMAEIRAHATDKQTQRLLLTPAERRESDRTDLQTAANTIRTPIVLGPPTSVRSGPGTDIGSR